ncbi:MAG: acyl-CoA dehydrogenase [Methylococcaceae bacterium]|nr:acyl-CoA dehydrogenase [Methylococcaceae bacterium]
MLWLFAFFALLFLWAYAKLPLPYGSLFLAGLISLFGFYHGSNPVISVMATFLLLFLVLINIPITRRPLLSRPVFRLMHAALPKMSQTEKEALEAGNTWWDAQLFSGQPDWKVLLDLPPAKLSAEEQDYINGQVETLCSMLDDWDITHHRHDLPPEVWQFIKQNKLCGMIIPKIYGGLEFSEYAHSQVVMKLASRSTTAAVTVMVPNSLGPAKLLLAYGTDQQKNHYLPKLASGEELPAFALTGPYAGSDASAMPDTGIVCYRPFEGQDKMLGILLNWEKRYITLGPVATVLGLAFKLYDPDHLIGDQKSIGITVALIPTNTPGISIGRRHNPLDSAFQNGPNWGKDVFIPMDWVIGGVEQVGNGWKMLMQCLATGRALSLPALSTGAAKFTCRNTGAYARIRKQFNLPIGEFEGIEEPLARIAGETYIMDAARSVTAAALDNGQKPAVISAIIKYQLTERMRRVINDGMDIQGGSGICLGPRNFLGRLYQVVPVSITVEGANILTRTMMIFGQGAIRCHPFIQKEMAALTIEQSDLAIQQFDKVLLKHIAFIMHNLANSLWLGLSNARLTNTPGNINTQQYYRQLTRLSAIFALSTDFALLSLGGELKRKERISGRFADVLSNLYLCSCVLKHYEDQGAQKDDLPLLDWACQKTLFEAQQSLSSIFDLLPARSLGFILSMFVFPIGKPLPPPADNLNHRLAKLLLNKSAVRDRLTSGIYMNENPDDVTGKIEVAFNAVAASADIEKKISLAQKQQQLPKGNLLSVIDEAIRKRIITQSEASLVLTAEQARLTVITVDDFSETL